MYVCSTCLCVPLVHLPVANVYVCSIGLFGRLLLFRWFMYVFVLQACASGYYSSAGSCATSYFSSAGSCICLFYRLVQPVTIVPLVHVYVCSTGLCSQLL